MKFKIISIVFLSYILVSCSSTPKKEIKEVEDIENTDFQKEPPVKYEKSKDFYDIDKIIDGDPNSLVEETVDNLPEDKLEDVAGLKDGLAKLISNCYQGNFEKAFAYIETLYDKYKRHPGYWTQVGSCYLKKGEIRKANLFYQKAIELNKKYAPAYNNIGNIHLYNKEYEKALAAFKKARSFNRFSKVPTYNLGQMYLNFGVIDRAIKLFGSINNQRPGDPNIFNGLATAYLFKGDLKRSLATYKKIPASYMRLPKFGINYSVALFLSGDKKLAKRTINRIRKDDLGKWRSYYERIGEIISQGGDA